MAAVVVALDAEEFIGRLITELIGLSIGQVVVVANDSTDATALRARGHGARVVEVRERLTERRAIARGIAACKDADGYVCVTGRAITPARFLAPFVQAVAGGADIALGDASSWIETGKIPKDVAVAGQFLSCALGYREVDGNCFTTYPFALSRRTVECVGCEALAHPAGTLAVASRERLVVQVLKHTGMDCDKFLLPQEEWAGLEECLVGLATFLRGAGSRGGFADRSRNRSILEQWLSSETGK